MEVPHTEIILNIGSTNVLVLNRTRENETTLPDGSLSFLINSKALIKVLFSLTVVFLLAIVE